MCGRFTKNYTWQQIQALYRLTVPAAIPNMQPSFNVCPIRSIPLSSAKAIESWFRCVADWYRVGGTSRLRELRLATLYARIETVTMRPFSANRPSTVGV